MPIKHILWLEFRKIDHGRKYFCNVNNKEVCDNSCVLSSKKTIRKFVTYNNKEVRERRENAETPIVAVRYG